MKIIVIILSYMLIGVITNLGYQFIYDRMGTDKMINAVKMYQQHLSDEEAIYTLKVIEILCLYTWPLVWFIIIYCSVYLLLNKDWIRKDSFFLRKNYNHYNRNVLNRSVRSRKRRIKNGRR